MLVNAIEMLNKAKKGNYAVPQFNINNLEWTKAILEECEDNDSPVILGVSEGATKYMGGYNTVASLVKGLIKDLNINVSVCLHLDHGKSFDSCKKAMESGFTSVMIDASMYELDENIKIVKEVINLAKQKNVSVEAEVGHVGGIEDSEEVDVLYAEISDCKKLVIETNVNFLAPALGSVHGEYKGEPKINFERMNEINKIVGIPLVLHGGTGLSDEIIKNSIENGINKINFNTELQMAWSQAVRMFIENYSTYDPRKIISSGVIAIKNVVRHKINLLGCANKN
ncbi:MAG: class II fructose-1,6-bisphosphate aldolase [Mollicutes bacterium]|nr:class II fructose-1,6-bisphosphate aldolase [Mollicutes bacterium]